MGLPALTIVPAGAGSGKTFRIKEQLGRWIADGLVEPERIAAVTYTEAAAAELRQRIKAKLLSMGRVDDALRLDQAYMTTIHGFGLRLLTEFAFQAGESPQPRLLNEDEQNALIRRALARTDKLDAIIADLEAFGYAYDFVSGRSAEDVFRDDMLRAMHLLRSIGLATEDAAKAHAARAIRRMETVYGEAAAGRLQQETLRQAVEALLREFPESLAERHTETQTARNDLRRDFQNLSRARRPGALDRDWKLWQALRVLRLSTRRVPLPDGYDELAGSVRAAANHLVPHIGPLRQAGEHLRALLTAGHAALEHYQDAKRQTGLVDYSDMIARAERLLRERDDVLATLADRIDCLVVDEFQDTNPLQFALLWQLKERGIPTLAVGDLKQAIMGFQGADPRLFEALERNHRSAVEPLTSNWRSQPPLMDFINAAGPVLFGADYPSLEPESPPSPLEPLEFVAFAKNPQPQAHAVRAYSVGQRLKQLLDDPGQTIRDRRTGANRRLRGGDIAVLCPTNAMLAVYADVLRALGLRVNHQAEGWFASRAVQLAWHALAYMANSADRHAALYLAVTELGSLSLEEGLRQLMDGGRIRDPLLAKLDALTEGLAERTVYALVADTLAALNLFDCVAQWPDAEQARANLVRLLGEASEFMDSNREALALGGFHGSGVQTFLAWLKAKAATDDNQPDKKVLDEEGVVLKTWHRSKGLEWPVVAVCGLQRQIQPRLPNLELGYSSFDDLARVLENVQVEYAPAFAAPERNLEAQRRLRQRAVTEIRRLLYVAFTRARDKLVLEWPWYLAGKNAEAVKKMEADIMSLGSLKVPFDYARTKDFYKTYWAILENDFKLDGSHSEVEVGGKRFPCTLIEGAAELPDEFVESGKPGQTGLPITGRRAIRPGEAPTELTPERRPASELAGAGEAIEADSLRVERYGEGLDLELDLAGTELGSFLHECFEVLGSRPGLADRLPELTGVPVEPPDAKRIAEAVSAFEAWLATSLGVESSLREWPVLLIDEQGTVISGTADLIARTGAGVWVWDHKSDRTEDPARTFAGYLPQLEAYAQALADAGEHVLGIGINWVRRGEAMWRRLDSRPL